MGSPVSVAQDWAGTEKGVFFLITSNEYYVDSGLLSVSSEESPLATLYTNTAMAKATYGQLWACYAFKINQSSAAAIGAQEPDNIIFVG